MRVLITGCDGQVGRELMLQSEDFACKSLGFNRSALDITDQKSMQIVVKRCNPDVVINAAAYTAVDKAESDMEVAYAVNATAVEYLAEVCADLNIPLVHISTDYVFDGSKVGAYKEDDPVNPLGVYGKSKLEGEEAVKRLCEKYYILRTSWVFSSHGNNFVKTMLRLGAEREQLGVVADQYGKPTSACEIAGTIYMMLKSSKEAWGTYHVAQPDAVSWYQFAEAIFIEAKKQGYPLKLKFLNQLTSHEYPVVAKRPKNSSFDCANLEKTFDFHLIPWLQSLQEILLDLQCDSELYKA